jgi:exodeoxyribonuclease V gamma subunit
VRAPLPPEEIGIGAEPGAPVLLSDLARFFEHPVRWFLQRRFGLYLREEIPSIEDREALHLDFLGEWIHRDALLRAELSGLDPDEAAARVRADGRLPPGAIGDTVDRASRQTVRRLLEQVRGLQGGQARPPVAVDLEIGGVRLVGEIGDLYPGGRVVLQHSKRVHPREIGFWIHHLVLCRAAPEGVPLQSSLVSRDGDDAEVALLGPCADSEPLLLDLLRLYQEGSCVPLPLLRQTSIAYAKAGVKQGWNGTSLRTARNAWEGSQLPGDRVDPYLAQAYRDVDPLDPEAGLPGLGFSELARRVWAPYLSRVEQVL